MMNWFYQGLPHKLKQIQYTLPKPQHFDALLGRPRIHRDFIYRAVVDNNLRDNIVMTYQGGSGVDEFFCNEFIWEPGCEQVDELNGTHSEINYHGFCIGISRIIPIDLFNRTAYSIVAETNYNNQYSFFTEKTAKPILAHRLFVMFSGYRFLENLRSLGFQTFDSVIDESYDLIENDHNRWSAAFEQVKRLCNMNQADVYEKIKDTLDHNYQVLINTNWQKNACDQIQEKINQIC
jgi:hypothetical protein